MVWEIHQLIGALSDDFSGGFNHLTIQGGAGLPGPPVTSRGPGASTGPMEGPKAGLAGVGQDLDAYGSCGGKNHRKSQQFDGERNLFKGNMTGKPWKALNFDGKTPCFPVYRCSLQIQ